jgi:hypothetical protein
MFTVLVNGIVGNSVLHKPSAWWSIMFSVRNTSNVFPFCLYILVNHKVTII